MFIKKHVETTSQLVAELVRLNPRVTITVDDPNFPQSIEVDCAPESLKLPDPFYYNSKNGITNKHKTKTGAYIALIVG
ncbi:MAG: hypothetical protein IJO08_01500 [Clostridia bacterium]|nr:hypothetical protein [Clostridia bacterium]